MTRAHITKKYTLATLTIGGAAAAAVVVAGCGGSSGGGTTAKAAAAPAGNVTVTTHSGGAGTHLTDASGRTLYLFTADTGMTSMCTGSCATEWRPLTAAATPHAAGTVSPTMIAVSARSGGQQQVTYGGHPLYYFAGDSAAGQTNGQGLNAFGGHWWLVNTHGQAVKGSTSNSNNGGGYGGYG
jgi:predicted lipoprotein with Yx(FWY)xxD motif